MKLIILCHISLEIQFALTILLSFYQLQAHITILEIMHILFFKFVAHKWESHTLYTSCNFKDASQIGDQSHGLVPRSRSTAVLYHPYYVAIAWWQVGILY
jgi:hypothetical protein